MMSSVGAGTRRGRAWLPVAAAMLVAAWGGNQFTPLLVMYRAERGFSQGTVDLVLAAYVLGIIPALLLGGPLSDRYGRRRLLGPAPYVSVLGSAVLALGAGSAVVLAAGRVLCGVAIGLAMAVGTSWVKELSRAPWDPAASERAGARRASAALTIGLMAGAAVAGSLAQWAPWPARLPFAAHVAVGLPAGLLLRGAPETVHLGPGARSAPLRDAFAMRALLHPALVRLLPTVPWVFGCIAVAYAVLPVRLAGKAGDHGLVLSTAATIVTLAAGLAAMPLGRRVDREGSPRGLVWSMSATALGMGLAGAAIAADDLVLALLAAAVLGAAYALNLVAGLLVVQRVTAPHRLGWTTAVYYSLGYAGFVAPAVLVGLNRWWSYPGMLTAGALAAAGVAVWLVGRRFDAGSADERAPAAVSGRSGPGTGGP